MLLPTSTDLTGLAGIALALSAAALAVPGMRRLSRPRRAALLAAVAVVSLIPVAALPAAGYVRGVTGDLSVTTLVLLGTAILRSMTGWPPTNGRARLVLLGAIAVAALALYPMALGVGFFDPYRLGYGSPWLVGGLLVAALATWACRIDSVAICLALATLAWSLRWYESTNLWDYLLDPLVSCYALGSLAVHGVRAALGAARGRRQAPPLQG
jgi:hypothetical protein